MRKKGLLLLTCLIAMSFIITAVGNADAFFGKKDKKIVWKFGHITNEDHMWHKTALKFKELVEKKTDGKIEVKIYPNSQLGNEIDTINSIKTGTADLTITGETMQNWAPKAALMAVPYAFRDDAHMAKIIDGEIGAEIKSEIIEKVGVTPIYYHFRAPRNLTSNRPITSPADLKGMIVRVPNVPIFVKVWEALGAKPTPMAFAEVFTALQQHTIAGQENPYSLIYTAGFYEVQKYINKTEHVRQWVYVVLGNKQYNSLTPELKKAVDEAAAGAQKYAADLFETSTAMYKQKLIEKGMKIIEVDQAAFQAKAEPAIKETLSKSQFELYQRIINTK